MSASEFEEAWSADTHPGEGRRQNARDLGESFLTETCAGMEMIDPVTVAPSDTIGTAIDVMVTRRIGCVLVVQEGRLLGVFTERDVMKRVTHMGYPLDRPVAEVMTPDPAVLSPGDPLVFVLNRMVDGGYRHVPIVDAEGRPVGVISVRCVVEWVVSHLRQEVLNLPPRVRQSSPPTIDGG